MASQPPPSLTAHLLSSVLPQELFDAINNHVLDPRSPVQELRRVLAAQAQRAVEAARPVVQPTAERLLAALVAALAENQGLVGVVASLLVLAVFVVLLNWIRRLVLWWTRMTLKLAFYAALAGLVAVVCQRGVLDSARDVTVLLGKFVAYAVALRDVWIQEYNRYEAQQGAAGARGSGR